MIRLTKVLSSIALFTLLCGQSQASLLIEGFENGLDSGVDSNGIPMGYLLFAGADTTTLAAATVPTGAIPPDVPGKMGANQVLQLDIETNSFAGIVNLFTNSDADTWLSQDWSAQHSISFWMFGSGSNTELFFDILNNRNPLSITDDAERFVYEFADDFNGWQLIDIPFDEFIRKEIGNGAPDDGLDLSDMRGWAIGSVNTSGPLTLFIDDVTAVPTPATLALVLIGLAGFGLRRKIH